MVTKLCHGKAYWKSSVYKKVLCFTLYIYSYYYSIFSTTLVLHDKYKVIAEHYFYIEMSFQIDLNDNKQEIVELKKSNLH